MQYKIINGSVSYDGEMVLENIDIEINEHEKIAVVGRNGCGKTSLFKAITGEVELEEGTGDKEFKVINSGSLTIGYLKQIPFEDENRDMLSEVMSVFSRFNKMEERLQELLINIEQKGDVSLIDEHAALSDLYNNSGGLTYKKEAHSMIKRFGFSKEDENKAISEFSGGQRTKIAFIKLLLSKPDILLLDEPTNHLDIETIEWLEDYLKSYKSALVLISHDRMFLERIVDKVYEIEYGESKCYRGKYSDFERQKRDNYLKQQKDHDAQEKEIARIQKVIDRFRYKKNKAKMAQSKIKYLERMKIIDAPNRYDLTTFKADITPRIIGPKEVLFAEKLSIGYNKPLANITVKIDKGERLGIIGSNGTGKSTFLKALIKAVPALSGSFRFGTNVEIGYFDQNLALVAKDISVFDSFKNDFPNLSDTEVRRALGAFLFTQDDVFRSCLTLSGGERVRLALCKIFKKKPNLLILDEPTNHLDIIGKETLESMLKEYSGTVIFVSHDRYFVNKIATKLLIFNSFGAEVFDGTFNEYEEKRKVNTAPNIIETKAEKSISENKNRYLQNKQKEKEKRRAQKLEEMINNIEKEINALREKLLDPLIASDYKKISEIEEKIEGLNKKQDNYFDEWNNIT